MSFLISVYHPDLRNSAQCQIEEHPDACPRCGTGLEQSPVAGAVTSKEHEWEQIQLCYRCPKCRRLFLANYAGTFSPFTAGEQLYVLQSTSPVDLKSLEPPSLVAQVCPSFSQIYNQAWMAEQMSWIDVAGPGFRKSLEFLTKDYLLSQLDKNAPDYQARVDEIKSKMMGPLMALIQDQNIKEVCEGAAWIGNDETHYERRWAEKDIQDLKEAIQLMLYWVDGHLRTSKLKADKATHKAKP